MVPEERQQCCSSPLSSSTMELESNYEITRVANYILTHNFSRVAFQFPDEQLKDAARVVRGVREKVGKEDEGVGLYVMADTTYGSCCVDEVGASHINADSVIHFGHTCLSPTTNLPALFVFGKASINVSDCARSLCSYASTSGKPTLEYLTIGIIPKVTFADLGCISNTCGPLGMLEESRLQHISNPNLVFWEVFVLHSTSQCSSLIDPF